MMKGAPEGRRKSVVVASSWAHQEAESSALEGVMKSSPFSCWQPVPWQSPGKHTDTDMPPLA